MLGQPKYQLGDYVFFMTMEGLVASKKLALIYQAGIGVKIDLKQARYWKDRVIDYYNKWIMAVDDDNLRDLLVMMRAFEMEESID